MKTSSTDTLEQSFKEILTLENVVENLVIENTHLKEQLAWFKNQLFGQKADKFVDKSQGKQLYFTGFDQLEKVPEETQKIPAHERKKRQPTGQDKITLSADLPIEQHVIDIPEEDKVCAETGEQLIKIGEEISSKLAHKPGSYFIKQTIRPKYALPSKSEEGIRIAPLPTTLLNRCQADESLLADILVKKFCDHLPLYRQSEILGREGIHISRQTLNQWLLRAGKALKPLYDEMLKQILKSNNIFYDETPTLKTNSLTANSYPNPNLKKL